MEEGTKIKRPTIPIPPAKAMPGDDLSSWSSWSALKEGRRKRIAVRLSASVDSIPYMDNDFLSSIGSLNNCPDFGETTEDDGSVNNILDALGGGHRTSSVAGLSSGSVSLLLEPTSSGIVSLAHPPTPPQHLVNPDPGIEVLEEDDEEGLMIRELSILSTPGNKRSPVIGLVTMTMTDGESSGLGSGASNCNTSSPTSLPLHHHHQVEPEDYEHVYCQLDPYFNPPSLSHTKSQPIVGPNGRLFSGRSGSLRSWGRSPTSPQQNNMVDSNRDSSANFIPFLQQALVSRYRGMLEEYLEAPTWYKTHMGGTELDEVFPLVYQVLPTSDKSIYATTSSAKKALLNSSLDLRHGTNSTSSLLHDPHNIRPILPHQIFNKNAEEAESFSSKAFWVEGESGSGKTLLCLKLVQEWISYHTFNHTATLLNTRIGEFQTVFFVPLKEVRGSLSRFLLKELIPKRSVASRIKASTLWKCLGSLGSSLLLILDGLDDVMEEEVLKEIEQLLNGQTFPQAMILVTSTPRLGSNSSRIKGGSGSCNPGNNTRKFLVCGMDWTQIQMCVRRYFKGSKFAGNEGRLCEILSERDDLCTLASNPLMCVLLCSVFEEVGDIPCSNAELFATLLRTLIAQNGLVKNSGSDSASNSSSSPASSSYAYGGKDPSIPSKYQKVLQDFGKLALAKLSEDRVSYYESEVMEFCGNLDICKVGVLSKPKSVFKTSKKVNKKTGCVLKLLHPALNSFLAAYYLAVTVNYPSVLRRELELLPGLEILQQNQVRLNSNPFQVLHYLMELLQNKSASVFLTMSLLDISLNYLLALLRAGGFYESNLRAVCGILRSVKQVQISVGSEWVSEWKQVISSLHCPFETAEILIRPGHSLSRITEGLCHNESITSVKFSSIPGSDWNPVEVNLICGQLLRLLCEKKLKCLEITMTCLEDKEHMRFQPVVDALCLALSKGSPLKKLVLDMDLTSGQVIQLVSFIKCHEYLEVLHLPHLGCGPDGFRALADLLRDKPLVSLSLAGAWRSNSVEEESQVVLEPFPLLNPLLHAAPMMGSKLGGGAGFSSLPRGGNGSIKSPSIRRKKGSLHGPHNTSQSLLLTSSISSSNNTTRFMGGTGAISPGSGGSSSGCFSGTEAEPNKLRNSDSVLFQRNFLPLPICDRENHEVDGFHEIFTVLRSVPNHQDNLWHLTSLNLSKCVMNWEDVICLGETIRKMNCLDSLRMEGMKLCDVLPVLLGLQENKSLKMLDLSSPHVVMGDDALQLAANSLAKNTSLRLLAIQGWTIYIEEERSLECLESLFASSTLQDLDLTSVRIHVNQTSPSAMNGTFNRSAKSPVPPGTPTTANAPTSSSRSNSVSSTLRKSSKDLKLSSNLKPKGSLFFSGSTLSLGKGHHSPGVQQLEQNGVEKRLCPELGFLRLGGIQVEMRKSKQTWKSHEVIVQLLPLLDKGKITYLDISLDKNEGPLGTQSHLDEKTVLKTFKLVGQHLPKLQTLVVKNWKMRLSNDKACKEIGKCLNPLSGTLCGLTMDNCAITCDAPVAGTGSSNGNTNGGGSGTNNSPRRIDCNLVSSLLMHLKNISDFSWGLFDQSQMSLLAKTFCESPALSSGTGRFQLKLEGVSLPSIKSLLNAASIKPNAASGVNIEYLGNHTVVVFKSKERNEQFMHRIKRFWE